MRQVQDDLDRKIRDLEIQHTELLRQTGSLQSQIEEKTRCVKEMEQMMNTERTRSLLEVARLKETLRKRKRKGGKVVVEEEERRESTPSINATPIKVVNSPSSFIQNERKRSSSFSEKEEEEEEIKEEEGEREEEEAGRRVNTSTDTSSTVLSDMLNNLSNVVNELGQQLNPS